MLFLLMATEPYLPPGYTHDATDWEIATDPEFNNIVWTSYNDTINKTIKLVDLDIDTNNEYFARVRYIFNKYVSEPSDAILLDITDKTVLLEHFDLPSIVKNPIVSIDQDPNNCSNAFFTVTGGPFSTTSNARHLSTTYIIRNVVTGKAEFFLSDDTANLYELKINKALKPGYTYLVNMIYKSTSNDVSVPGSLVIYVPDDEYIVPINENNRIDGFGYSALANQDLTIQLNDIPNLLHINIDLYMINDGKASSIYTATSNTETFIIPGSSLALEADSWIIHLSATFTDGSTSRGKYLPIVNSSRIEG